VLEGEAGEAGRRVGGRGKHFFTSGGGRSTARSPVWKVRPVMRDTVALWKVIGEVAVVEDGGSRLVG
jgi:hypothetical protein